MVALWKHCFAGALALGLASGCSFAAQAQVLEDDSVVIEEQFLNDDDEDGDDEVVMIDQTPTQRCAATFRSFDPADGTYVTYDGETRTCPYLVE